MTSPRGDDDVLEVEVLSPEVMTMPSSVSVMLSIGVLLYGSPVGLRRAHSGGDRPVRAEDSGIGVVDRDVFWP